MIKKLSIIVPVYNVENYLDKCLQSLLNQNSDDYEILLINDGSTDGSKNICSNYQKKHPDKIKLYNKRNGGLSSARNYGLKKANSEYIFFVDSDDYIEKNCLKEIFQKIGNNDILVFNYKTVCGNKFELFETYDKTIIDIQKRFIVSTPSACNKIFKTSLFKNNNISFPENIYYEDLSTIPALAQYTSKIVYTNEAYYYYYQRENSIMHQKKYNNKIEDIFNSISTLENRFIVNNQYTKYYQEIEYIYIWHLLRNASLRFLEFNKLSFNDKIVNVMKKKYPKWSQNKYFKNYSIKKKIICLLFFYKKYNIINYFRKDTKHHD